MNWIELVHDGCMDADEKWIWFDVFDVSFTFFSAFCKACFFESLAVGRRWRTWMVPTWINRMFPCTFRGSVPWRRSIPIGPRRRSSCATSKGWWPRPGGAAWALRRSPMSLRRSMSTMAVGMMRWTARRWRMCLGDNWISLVKAWLRPWQGHSFFGGWFWDVFLGVGRSWGSCALRVEWFGRAVEKGKQIQCWQNVGEKSERLESFWKTAWNIHNFNKYLGISWDFIEISRCFCTFCAQRVSFRCCLVWSVVPAGWIFRASTRPLCTKRSGSSVKACLGDMSSHWIEGKSEPETMVFTIKYRVFL